MVFSEFGRTLTAETRGHHIAAPVAVVHTSEEGDEAGPGIFIGIHGSPAVLQPVTCTHIPGTGTVYREIVVRHIEALAVLLIETVAEDCIHRMVVREDTVEVNGRLDRYIDSLVEFMIALTVPAVLYGRPVLRRSVICSLHLTVLPADSGLG